LDKWLIPTINDDTNERVSSRLEIVQLWFYVFLFRYMMENIFTWLCEFIKCIRRILYNTEHSSNIVKLLQYY